MIFSSIFRPPFEPELQLAQKSSNRFPTKAKNNLLLLICENLLTGRNPLSVLRKNPFFLGKVRRELEKEIYNVHRLQETYGSPPLTILL